MIISNLKGHMPLPISD